MGTGPHPLRRKLVRLGAYENGFKVVMHAVSALMFLGAGMHVVSVGEGDTVVSLLGGLLFVTGGLFVFAALHMLIGRGKFGNVTLTLHTPVSLGGELDAELVLPRGHAGIREIEATLRCRRVIARISHDGKQILDEDSLLERSARFALVRHRASSAACAIRMKVPENAPASMGETSGGRLSGPGVYWDLLVNSSDIPGVDLMRGYQFLVVAGGAQT